MHGTTEIALQDYQILCLQPKIIFINNPGIILYYKILYNTTLYYTVLHNSTQYYKILDNTHAISDSTLTLYP